MFLDIDSPAGQARAEGMQQHPAAPTFASVRHRFEARFGNVRESVIYHRIINEYPFHNAEQPGKGHLMKFFMLAALDAPEQEKRATYEQLRKDFKRLRTHLQQARQFLREQPGAAEGEDPHGGSLKRRAWASGLTRTAAILASVLPVEDSYEALEEIMTPLVQKFKAAREYERTTADDVAEYYRIRLDQPAPG